MSEEVEQVGGNQTKTKSRYCGASWFKNTLENVANQILKPQPNATETPPTCLSLFLIFLGIVIYVVDIVSDLYLAIHYFNTGQFLYYQLTLTFVLFPASVVFIINLKIISNKEWNKSNYGLPLLILFGPVYRDSAALFYGLKSRKNESSLELCQIYHSQMLEQSSTCSSLKLFESFLESAPQATLQTYILIVQHHEQGPSPWQFVSLGLSFCGLSWSIASCNRRILAADQVPFMVAYIGSVVECLGYLFLIMSRCFALAAFASLDPYENGVTYCLLSLTGIIILSLVVLNKFPELEGDSMTGICTQLVICLAFSWMYCFLFCHFDRMMKKTKIFVFYYATMLVSNSIALCAWLRSVYKVETSNSYQVNLAIEKVVVNYVLFFLGISFLVVYNVNYHPSKILGSFPTDIEENDSSPNIWIDQQLPNQPADIKTVEDVQIDNSSSANDLYESTINFRRKRNDEMKELARYIKNNSTNAESIVNHIKLKGEEALKLAIEKGLVCYCINWSKTLRHNYKSTDTEAYDKCIELLIKKCIDLKMDWFKLDMLDICHCVRYNKVNFMYLLDSALATV